ncbi:hypothetical protein MnTg02_01532 [bacterium MnTg02]|nr:hypothetical protein MnTg02_01532 [bacterium MnTg02]
MNIFDPGKIGARQVLEHSYPQIGDKAVAEIDNGDLTDIFSDGFENCHDDDCNRDCVQHLEISVYK